MAKFVCEYETKYDKDDIVVFRKNGSLMIGIIEGYWRDCDQFWYNIKTSSKNVYTYNDGGDIAEYDIIYKFDYGTNYQEIKNEILRLR